MNNQNKDKKPNDKGNPDRFQPKVLIIWGLIVTAIISLWVTQPKQTGKMMNWTIAETLQAAERGDIQNGYIESDKSGGSQWYVLRGELNPGVNIEIDQNAIQDPAVTEDSVVRFHAQGRLTENDYTYLREILVENRESTLMVEILVSIVPFLLIIGLLYYLFTRQLKMAGKGAMGFGKSRAKMLTLDKDKITFDQVAGCDEAKEEVAEIVEFLKNPKKFQDIGGKIPKGVLMEGPPGTGKTLLAKAVAGEADVPFFSISGSDFVEMFVGVGAARVRDMFEQGRKSAPCIMFIDEIDAVGRQRGVGMGGGNDEREQTLNSLLVEMDGFDSHEGVIIIAATNRADVLDSALLRPGRFDRQVTIDLPDLNGRFEILEVHAKGITLKKDLDLEIVARNTPGFSGADLANLLNEGALIAARHGKKEVDIPEIDEAREKISWGRERKRLMDYEERRLTAYHEAGHAIVQAVIDDGLLPVYKVTIIPRGQSLGSTMFIPTKDILSYTSKQLYNRICCAMGGRAAEKLVLDDITNGAYGDIRQATQIARSMVCDYGMSSLGPVALSAEENQYYSQQTAREIDSEIKRVIEEQYDRAVDILKDRYDAMDVLAKNLLEYETLDGSHVKEILETGQIQTPIKISKPKATKKDNKAGDDESNDDNLVKTKPGKLGTNGDTAGIPA